MIISISDYKAKQHGGLAAFKVSGAADRKRALLMAGFALSDYAQKEGKEARRAQDEAFSLIWDLLPGYYQRAVQSLIDKGVNLLDPETYPTVK